MQEETVVFKFDVSKKRIKRRAMKAVWKFSGVNLVDIKEKGKLKVRGTFSKIEMGLKLKKIDKSVDIIDSMGNEEQNYNHGNVPKMQESIFRVSNVRKANTIIWEFSGVTSVELKGINQLVVKGEFDDLEMLKKLDKKDKYVTVLKVEEHVEAPAHVANRFGTNQFDAGSSNGPKAPERSNSVPVAQPQVNQPQNKQQEQAGGLLGLIGWNNQEPPVKQPPQRRAWNNQQPQNNQLGQGGFLANLGLDKLKPQFKKQGQVGGLFGFLGMNKQQPKIEHPRQDFQAIERAKAEKLRIEKEQAEKLRIEKEQAEMRRIEEAKAEKRRIEKAKAEKRRIEKAKEAERLRIEKAKAEKLRIERERADELRRRNSTSRTGGQGTQTQTQGTWGNSSWLTGLSTTASLYSSRLTGAIGSTLSNTTMNPFSTQTTGASGSTLPTNTVNPFSSQSTRVNGTTTTNPFTSQSTRTSRSTRY